MKQIYCQKFTKMLILLDGGSFGHFYIVSYNIIVLKSTVKHFWLTLSHCFNLLLIVNDVIDWTAVAKRQLTWLVVRLPGMRELSLQGCSWLGASALRTCTCPPLTCLDLSFVTGLNDASLRDLLSPPPDSRPGLVDTKSRLRHVHTLKLAGCDLSDVSLR